MVSFPFVVSHYENRQARGGGRWNTTAASGSGLVRDPQLSGDCGPGASTRTQRDSSPICCSASERRTILTVDGTRTDGTTACVESNARNAAKTYCNADRAIRVSLSQPFQRRCRRAPRVQRQASITKDSGPFRGQTQQSRHWLRGQDLHLRLEVMSLSYCPTLLPRHKSNARRNGPGGRS
jgi:hypothetical protein